MKLGELYSDLEVRDSSFRRSMSAARANLRRTGGRMDRLRNRGISAFRRLSAAARRFGATVKAVGAAVKAAFMAVKTYALIAAAAVGGLVYLAGKQEKAEKLLESALKATGQASAGTAKRLRELAAAIQRETTVGDEATLGIMALGLNMGISADKIGEATKQAIALSKVYKLDLSMAMRGVALAHKDEFLLLNRYIPTLRTAQTVEEKRAAFLEATSRGYRQAQDEAKTFTGSMEQLKNSIGDMLETAGAALVPMISDLAAGIRDMLPGIRKWIEENNDLLVSVGRFVASEILDTMRTLGGYLKIVFDLIADNKDSAREFLDSMAGVAKTIRAVMNPLPGLWKKIRGETARAADEAERFAAAGADGAPKLIDRGGFARPVNVVPGKPMNEQFDPRWRRGEVEGRAGGFTGLADLAKRIQQNVFDREKRQRERKMIELGGEQLKTQREIVQVLKAQGVGLEIS